MSCKAHSRTSPVPYMPKRFETRAPAPAPSPSSATESFSGAFLWLCHRKWLMLFPLKFQRNNRQNTLAMHSAKGKAGGRGCIFYRAVEMKQPHTMTEPFLFRSVQAYGKASAAPPLPGPSPLLSKTAAHGCGQSAAPSPGTQQTVQAGKKAPPLIPSTAPCTDAVL